jgi:pyruvate dehydrogenase (quinone)
MAQNVGSFLLRRLHAHGVERIYGYPGDGINGILGAFHELGDEIEFIQTRHEELAAFMATAQAKVTGKVGVCMATSGPGAIHLLNGLYDAKLDHQPVLAIVGQQKMMSLGSNYQQEVDLVSLFKDVAHEYVHMCTDPAQMAHLVDRAMRIAEVERTVTCLIVPADVQDQPYEEPPREHGAVHSSPAAVHKPRVIPADADLQAAAQLLNEASKPAILIGAGAAGAPDEVIAMADKLGCGVAKALNGRSALPDDLPFVTGSIGLLGTKPSEHMMSGCDALLMVGSSFPYSEWLPEPGQARGVQIDLDARMLGIRFPMEVNLAGDAGDTLRALLPMVQRKENRAWRQEIEHEVERWWEILAGVARQPADPINPQLLFHELSERLPDGCILTADSGSATNWWARHLKLRQGMKAILSGTLATMCPAVPYALAAKLAYPSRPVIACLGDGAMQMLGINGLIDIAKYADRFTDPRLVILVLNNHDLNQVTWEQRVMEGDPKLDVSQDIPDFPYARYAELLGLKGIKVDEPDAVGFAWDGALSADRPTLIEAVVDPEVPPLPPHIRFEQAKELAQAIRKGDPAAGRFMRHAIRGKAEEFLHR